MGGGGGGGSNNGKFGLSVLFRMFISYVENGIVYIYLCHLIGDFGLLFLYIVVF
jgi:hypothetical protein